MKPPKPNIEQLEAKEIDTLPRLVITPETVFVFKHPKGPPIAFSKNQIAAISELMDVINKHRPKT